MRIPPVAVATLAAAAIAVMTGAAAAPARAREAAATHTITLEAGGPLAFVEVTRTLEPPANATAGEQMLDVALPERSLLVAVEVRDGVRWRSVDAADPARVADQYRDESAARGVTPVSEPFDDDADYRLRVVRGKAAKGAAPSMIRYRFSSVAVFSNGRYRVRFPGAPEKLPAPADVTVTARDAADVEIAGARTELRAAGASARGNASTRTGWEVSWAPRDPAPTAGAPSLEARVALAQLSRAETALAVSARSRPAKSSAAPSSVLLVVDRSRSVGLPGLATERDLARRLLEALPPSTRFDAVFFDRTTKRLFPMGRPATREAIDAFEVEMVPDRMQNGTDLPAALREAAALLRREQTTFAPHTLLVVLTDGALPADADSAALDRALGTLSGLELSVAAFIVRAIDDDPAPAPSRQALQGFAAAHGGVARDVRAASIEDAVTGALGDLGRGGDFAGVRVHAGGRERLLAEALAPGAAASGVIVVAERTPRAVHVEASAHGRRVKVAPRVRTVAAEWLRPWLPTAGGGGDGKPAATATAVDVNRPRLLATPTVLALVEPVVHPATAPEAVVKGSMDRLVMRNVLSLAYMPRARACYLARSGATAALRDLTGRVRLAIDVVRGEVERAAIESSTLNNADVETCLREGAFAVDVPRVMRNDAPVTAILNLVFRPQTPEKKREHELGAVGDQIDLIIEEANRSQTK
jgi:Mg-chelatase subunit ChlD